MNLTTTTSGAVITSNLSEGAIVRDDFHGFRDDYLVLHCLMRRWRPRRVLEIGTHLGRGTSIICNAVGADAWVYSLDLPDELAERSPEHPSRIGHRVGALCSHPYRQLWGDSLSFPFDTLVSIDAAYVDGHHDAEHVAAESRALIALGAQGIVWHDTDIPEVWEGLRQAFEHDTLYRLTRVTDTRITFAERGAP